MAALAVLALAGALAGCTALGGITGALAGAASGSASGNPGVGIAVAIGVKGAVDAAQKKLDRHLQHKQQQAIATQAGALSIGAEGPWQVRQITPWEDAQGRVRVLREFTTPLAECREAAFTIVLAGDSEDTATSADGSPSPTTAVSTVGPTISPYFITTVCRSDEGWRWALAEPAVARWGSLQ